MPRVSVVLPAYNHERFITATIRSALEQDFRDLEVIVCDDASTDGTLAALMKIEDPRLKVLTQPRNLGGSEAARRALDHARGEYIARLSSDDLCLPGRIRQQVEWLDQHPETGCVFALPEFIDEEENTFLTPPKMASAFAVENRPRRGWLRHFFEEGNALCLPSAMLRRSTLAEVPPPRSIFHHLPDFEYWVRFCLKYEIHILPDRLTAFRIQPEGGNLSAPDPQKAAEAEVERLAIWRHFLTPEGLEALGFADSALGRLELAEFAMKLGGRTRTLFALQTIQETDLDMASEEVRREFLLRARPLLRGNDAMGTLERSRLRTSRDKWRESHDEVAAELKLWKKSRLGRWFGRFIQKPEARL